MTMTAQICVKRIVGSAILCLALSSASVWAQFTSAITGTVTDPSGAVVPSAAVTIENAQTGESRSVNTSSDGLYRFCSVPAALFDVTVSSTGFNTLVQHIIRLTVDEVKTVNLKLAV